MSTHARNDKRIFEIMSIVLALGMTALFYKMGGQRMVALNLFFLPVVLAGYFLGRASAGALALFCALVVTIATTLGSTGFEAYEFPVMVGLALTVWASVLGLTAILVGTLCDERARTANELHKAYVGVVDVLAKYLQSANPEAEARTIRIAELSQEVAREMKLPRKQIDDIRVAALLRDLESVEVTTQLINKAVDTLEADASIQRKSTFLGTDLVHSLSSVLEGALPLLVNQEDGVRDCLPEHGAFRADHLPLGTKIITTVRAYCSLASGAKDAPSDEPQNVLRELRNEVAPGHEEVIAALGRVIREARHVMVPQAAC